MLNTSTPRIGEMSAAMSRSRASRIPGTAGLRMCPTNGAVAMTSTDVATAPTASAVLVPPPLAYATSPPLTRATCTATSMPANARNRPAPWSRPK